MDVAVLALSACLTVAGRPYHMVPMDGLATTTHTHVQVTGRVVYVRKQRDGDVHVTLDNGTTKVVLEIIPQIPATVPRKGQTVTAYGIARLDAKHRWPEVHPVECLTIHN